MEGSATPTLEDNMTLTFLPEPEPPEPISFSCSGRRRKAPHTLKDYLPHSLVRLPLHLRLQPVPLILIPNPMAPTTLQSTSLPPSPELEPKCPLLTTETNGFGLYQQYMTKP